MWVMVYTANFSKLLQKYVLPVPINLCSACLEASVAKREMFLQGVTKRFFWTEN